MKSEFYAFVILDCRDTYNYKIEAYCYSEQYARKLFKDIISKADPACYRLVGIVTTVGLDALGHYEEEKDYRGVYFLYHDNPQHFKTLG